MRLSSLGPWSQRGRSVWTASYADPTFARWISSAVSTLLRRWAASGDRPASVATDRLSTIKATVRMEAPSRARKDSRRSGRSPGGSAVPRRLEREQLGVQPASRHELLVRPLVHQLAPLQHENAVGHPHGGEAVRDQDGHAAVCQLREPQEHLVLRPRVERRRGLVEDQNLRIAHVSPPQRYLLPLAPRQGDTLARLEQEPKVPHGPAIGPGIAEADALELEPAPDGRGHGPRARLRRDPGPHVEEGEQVREVQALLEHLRHGEQDALNQVAALAKRPGEER